MGIPIYAARRAALWLLFALAVLDVATLRGLNADGANVLVHVLADRTFFHVNDSRWAAEILTQLPIVAAVKLGVTNLRVLLVVYSLSVVAPPAIFWMAALARLRGDDAFWFFFVLFCIVYFNVSFFAIGEYNTAYALAAFSMAIIGARAPLTLPWALAALFAALCLIASYESMIFLGPLLVILAGLRSYTPRPRPAVIALLGLCMASYIAGTAVAALAIRHPRDPVSFANAVDLGTAARNGLVALSIVFAVGYVASLARAKAVRQFGLGLAIPCLIAILCPRFWSSPLQHYQSRALAGVVVFLFGLLLIACLLLRDRFASRYFSPLSDSPLVVAAPLLLFLGLSVSDVTHSIGFAHFLDDVSAEVGTRSGLVPLEDTRLLAGSDAIYGWGWSYPLLSILLRRSPHQGIILNAAGYNGFQPFDPHVMVPDLRAYYPAQVR